jgi:tetratricopeptide (TPR) repeat protein
MRTKISVWGLSLLLSWQANAQKSKVQAAWRALNDYEETMKEGKADLSYLTKANEAIDMALANEDTKNQTKAHAYKLRISYATFQYNLRQELVRLEGTVKDKNERSLMAYGNTPLKEFEVAAEELNKIKELDPKFLDNIQQGISAGSAALDDEELKFATATMQMKAEAANIATGKYTAKKFAEAADYFYKTGMLNTLLSKSNDTASFYNACISAARANDLGKILSYNAKMIDMKIGGPGNYSAMGMAYTAKGDTAAAMDALKKGRENYPNDLTLLNEQANLFMAKGESANAIANLTQAAAKDPNNAFVHIMLGTLYDNQANPKDAAGKDLPKPAAFDDLFKKAESAYLKAIALQPTNKEYFFTANYNLGAMYNNYGGFIATRKPEKSADMVKAQKEIDEQAKTQYKKAIPYLETAYSLRPEEKSCAKALRLLYLQTGNEAKAKEMSDRIGK